MSERRATVLVVDDSEICLELASDALSAAGFAVVTSSTPFGASKRLRESGAACVVVDVSMPALSGDRLVEILRRAGDERVPILLHSDRPYHDLVVLAQSCGAAGAVPKTADCKPLVDEVRRVTARARRG